MEIVLRESMQISRVGNSLRTIIHRFFIFDEEQKKYCNLIETHTPVI